MIIMPSLAARASEVEARDELEQHVMWETPLALWREEEKTEFTSLELLYSTGSQSH